MTGGRHLLSKCLLMFDPSGDGLDNFASPYCSCGRVESGESLVGNPAAGDVR